MDPNRKTLTSDDRQIVSRRQMVGLVSTPLVAAAMGSSLLGSAAAAEDTAAPSNSKTSGLSIYNIRNFGAKGDGTTLDTAAIQAAIDAANHDRGGIVLVPAGDFLCGTVQLKSNVTLHLSAQGRILGSGQIQDYSAGKGVPPGNGNFALLYAADAENVTIEGRGTIDGQGVNFYNGVGDGSGPGGSQGPRNVERPHLLIFSKCKNVLLRDAFFTRSAYHCCRILQCQYVHIDGIRIYNRVNKNNDGFHFNSSQYVNIANCNISCQDDACALFGSNKFVTVTNCSFSTRWSIFRFGGGEAENITVSNCIIYETYGCPIKMSCGPRSRFENMIFSNLVLKDVTGPVSIGLSSARRRSDNAAAPAAAGIVRNIVFSGLRGTVVTEPKKHDDIAFDVHVYPGERKSCIVLNGVGDNVLENISFTDVQLKFAGGGTAEEAAAEVPQIAGEYFQIGTPPAYGMYARNVRGLTLNNVRFELASPDVRPAVVFDHVQDAAITNLSAQGDPKAESVVRFFDSKDVLMIGPRVLSPAAAFLQVEGKSSEEIVVDGGNISKAAKPMVFSNGATEQAIQRRV